MQDNYNAEQLDAIQYSDGHALVLAGVGTGKTRTIIGRAEYLIDNGTDPSRIQILTFTKRAAAEIVERVAASTEGSENRRPRGATFHSWCNQLITKFPNLFGAPDFTVIDPDDQLGIMKMVCGDMSEDFGQLRLKPRQLIDLYSFARNTGRNLTESIRTIYYKNKRGEDIDFEIEGVRIHIETLLRAYQQRKMARRYLDYDDLLLVVASRLQQDQQAREILAGHIDHILVDEMQDTNPLQWMLLKPFLEMATLFCVGDDAQSIYSFRGADFRNVHSFGERVPGSHIFILQRNYRSTQKILDLSNWLLSQSPIDYKKQLQAVKGMGKLPMVVNVANQWEESRFIGDYILRNFGDGNKKFSDHLVLSRSQYYTKSLQAVFIQMKIPYVTYGGRKFMEAAHIKDVVSLLRVVNNPSDEIGWMRFLTFWDGIGNIRATKIISNLLESDNPKECAQRIPEMIRGKEGERIGQLYTSILENSGNVPLAMKIAYDDMELQLAFKYRKDWEEKRRADFPVLEQLAGNYSTLGEFISEGVLENATQLNGKPVLEGSALKTTETTDHVIISTVHSAKGLEADTCFVLNVSPGAYPSAMSLGSTNEIEEERRVLYVALTRAIEDLIITRELSSINAKHTSDRTPKDVNQKSSSYFLQSVPENLFKQQTLDNASNKPKDIRSPNPLDLSFGMDFS